MTDRPSFEKISACVHCGLCLEACPTYRELRVEMDSPRGRLYLMKGLLNERIQPTSPVLQHLDQCLDCRACETACPSGVEYGHILEKTRTLLEAERPRSLPIRLLRRVLFRSLLPSRPAQNLFFKILWLQQALGLLPVARRVSSLAAQAPAVPFRSFRQRAAGHFASKGKAKHRVALFTGCAADFIFAGVRVLTENGCEVDVVPNERCCGALHIHNGEREFAKILARDNVAAFERCDVVLNNAAGCGAELRAYGELLETDAARAFGQKVRDISEFLVQIGIKPPRPRPGTVTYDEPCHLLHAQKISAAPKALLQAIPGLRLVPLADADACCGSAGIYSFTQPRLSAQILARKIEAIRESRAETVATGNPGCILQIRNGLRAAGLRIRVAHPIELLAEAYE